MLGPDALMLEFSAIVPPTVKRHVRGPVFSMQARKLPVPRSFRLVTLITLPPRPPRLLAPKPSAVGNDFTAASAVSRAAVRSTTTHAVMTLRLRMALPPPRERSHRTAPHVSRKRESPGTGLWPFWPSRHIGQKIYG